MNNPYECLHQEISGVGGAAHQADGYKFQCDDCGRYMSAFEVELSKLLGEYGLAKETLKRRQEEMIAGRGIVR